MPLSYAAERGHKAVVRILVVEGKANTNLEGDFDRTLLSYATKEGHETIVRLLLVKALVLKLCGPRLAWCELLGRGLTQLRGCTPGVAAAWRYHREADQVRDSASVA